MAPRLIRLCSWFTRGWADNSLVNYSTGFYSYCQQLAHHMRDMQSCGSQPTGYKPHSDHQGLNNSKCLLTTSALESQNVLYLLTYSMEQSPSW